MKQTRSWRSRITIPRLENLVLLRGPSESLADTLVRPGRPSTPPEVDGIEGHDRV